MGWFADRRQDRQDRWADAATSETLAGISGRLGEGDPTGAALLAQEHSARLITSGADPDQWQRLNDTARADIDPHFGGERGAWMDVQPGDSSSWGTPGGWL